jgi:hypothetical protein
MDEEEQKAAEAAAQAEAAAEAEARAKAAAEAALAAKAEADKKAPPEGDRGGKPTDEEARLLKDMMKQKKIAADAQKALEAANSRLAQFDGLDAEKVKTLVAAQEKAELEAAEKRGEYQRIIAQVREDADSRLKAANEAAKAANDQLSAAQRRIDDLTVGANFGSSRFINESTVLSGEKARRLYGDHFDIENGDFVAYDKPRGEPGRTPLVNPRTGDNLTFEAAIEKIVKADPDFERIARSNLKTGAGSQTTNAGGKDTKTNTKTLSGIEAISANLRRMSQVAK